MSEIVIYQSEDGGVHLNVNLQEDSIWLTQKQLAELFETTPQNITMHLKSIYKENELQEEATCKDILQVRKEGNREVKRKQLHYNLDAIISVGYRVKSSRATQFRIWANQVLKEYLVQGYALNKNRLAQKEQEIKLLKTGIQIIGRAIENKAGEEGLDWLDDFAKGLELLDDYDHESLDNKGLNIRNAYYPALNEYYDLVKVMKGRI